MQGLLERELNREGLNRVLTLNRFLDSVFFKIARLINFFHMYKALFIIMKF